MDTDILLYFGGGLVLAIMFIWFMECHEHDTF